MSKLYLTLFLFQATIRKFNTLQKNQAAIGIQRHVRGYNVRKKLPKEVRMKLMNILISPMPNRKNLAKNVLKDEGLDDFEAEKVVNDLEEAVKNKESIISKEEAMSLIPALIFQNNTVVSNYLR